MTLTLYTSPRFVEHALPPHLSDRAGGHPERPDRLRAVFAALRQSGMWPDAPALGLTTDFGLDPAGPPLPVVEVVEPADDATIALVHPAAYRRVIGDLARRGGGYADGGETYVGPASDTLARLAVAAVVRACDESLAGTSPRAFVAARPPGHHALPDRAMGFCLYATVAVAARHLIERRGLSRVAIVDFDVHHGNGTQAVLETEPRALLISLHGDPRTLWPGSGYASEIGTGAGEGSTLNLPLPPGSGDRAYLRAFDELVGPRLRAFGPQLLLVSAGFDAHRADPLAAMEVTEAGYAGMGARLRTWADELCGGRLVALLEGGYDLRALGRSVVAFLRAVEGAPDDR